MDIYDRILALEERVALLEAIINKEKTIVTSPSISTKKTTYFPAVSSELVELSNLDARIEQETRIERPVRRLKNTGPEMAAAVDAVAKAIELSKTADELVELVNWLAKQLVDSKK